MKNYLVISLLIFSLINSHSQPSEKKFGDIPKSDFEMKVYDKDKDAAAVVLFEQGNVEVILTNDFVMTFKYHTRIKILKRSGFDYANVEIPLLSSDNIMGIKASTFNLIGNELIETKVNKKSIIKQRLTDYHQLIKFAFPSVREGSIIEYSYEKTSQNINFLEPWTFQKDIPVRESEYYATTSDYLSYKYFFKGDESLMAPEYLQNKGNFSNKLYWIAHNIPAFRPETFIPAQDECILQVNFELFKVNYYSFTREISPSYATLGKELLSSKWFGQELDNLLSIQKYINPIMNQTGDRLERLKLIHEYVSQNILWNGQTDMFLSQTFKKTLKEKRGNSADLNLLLVAFLRIAGIKADPVVLSTRENGKLNTMIAEAYKLNYVVAKATIDNKDYLIDATDPMRPYYILPFECLNDMGRIINENNPGWAPLKNNEQNNTSTTVFMELNKNKILTGKVKKVYKSYDAIRFRKMYKRDRLEGFKTNLEWTYPEWNIDSVTVQNADSLYNDVIVMFRIEIKDGMQETGNYLIFSPMMIPITDNPFKDKTRKFPVNFGCPKEERFFLYLKLPEGYTFINKPKSLKISMPQNAGYFDYTLNAQDSTNTITLNSRFSIQKTEIPTSDYTVLQNFYDQVVKKNKEVVLIKYPESSKVSQKF